MRKALKFLGFALASLPIGALGLGAWVWLELSASLPDYSGERVLPGLTAPVSVERDALGVASIRASNRNDEARALGYIHAQERFFQMDLLRRSAAGELAALVGPAALPTDRSHRIQQLRATADRVVRGASASDRQWLQAYAAGVNAGLAALGSKPFEYWLLRQRPEAWQPEDSILVMGAMYFDLQDETAAIKRAEIVARDVLPAAIADLLYPKATAWDAPLLGKPGPPATVPAAGVYDLRRVPLDQIAQASSRLPSTQPESAPTLLGSNNWAIAGSRTASGAGIVANDPHLAMQAPSIWFRISLVRDGRRVTGASLPGVPVVVIGSNDRVAWGFTNSYGDWTDIIALDIDPANPSRYRTPDGWAEIEEISSSIEVARATPEYFRFEQSVFGPILGRLPDGRPYAVRWVAHDSQGYGLGFYGLHAASDAREAMTLAQASGLPAQNIVVADRDGNIGWTIAGPIPRRRNSGRLSTSSRGSSWDGWLTPAEYPAVYNPSDGLIWTANGRVVEGAMLDQIGNLNYALGARGTQIRDRLRLLDGASAADMLAIQLDDEARFLSPWRDQLLDLLSGQSDAVLRAARDAVEDWGNRAGIDSVGYRLVRGWRLLLIQRMTAALTAEVLAADPTWFYDNFRQEHWAWALLSEEPAHLLDPRYGSWRDFKLATFSEYLEDVLGVRTPNDLARHTWGELNQVVVRHPLSQAIPVLSRWLDMPVAALPGDQQMPRVQGTGFGASARFAVSPGDAANAYFHMPGGQSGHPLSPYYGAGHDDWAAGRPTGFLPGATESSLVLSPEGA